jgi:hypothetical protein
MKILRPLIAPICISILILGIFHPGFMSYDSIHALRGARNGVTDSMWPPMVSYVWRLMDFIYPDPSLMFFAQVFLLLTSLSFLAYFLTGSVILSFLLLLAYIATPVILGTLVVIWKDVLMAAFFFAALALLAKLDLKPEEKKSKATFAIVYALIFLGVCVRHNAIVAALPLFALLSLKIFGINKNHRIRSTAFVLLLGMVFSGLAFFGKTVLDTYSLPEWKKINSGTELFVRPVRVLDIAGASVCVGQSLFYHLAPNLSIEEITANYDPRHINLSLKILDKIPLDDRVDDIWKKIAVEHPVCFFYQKYQVAMHMLGARENSQFIITNAAISENEYGFKLNPSNIRNSLVEYITEASKLFFLKPWFIYACALALILAAIMRRQLTVPIATILISSALYFAGLIFFGNAADARLPFFTTSGFLLVSAVLICNLLKGNK